MSAKKLLESSPRVLVVGDFILDHHVCGTSDRVSPEAPVPVVRVQDEGVSPGGAANVINNLLELGATVSGASVIGCDESGDELLSLLRQRDVDTVAILRDPERRTSRKTRIVAMNQQIVRFDNESCSDITEFMQCRLLDSVYDAIGNVDIILLSDYDKGVLTAEVTQQIITLARVNGVPIFADPKGSDYSKYCGVTLLTPNRKEASELSGISIHDQDSLAKVGELLKSKLELENLLITLSEEGMALFEQDAMTLSHSKAREVFDVSGAGDTVIATLAFCVAAGLSFREAAEYANLAAAVVVGKSGTSTTTWEEIFASAGESDSDRVKSIDDIEIMSRRLREQGRRIVFTNGCFDILHRGHVEYLKSSRSCGEVLIVGVNSDRSVSRLKGPSRPVNSENDRAMLLSELKAVDYVVVFDEETPETLIARIRPHVLTKGADYELHLVVGREFADECRLIPFVPGKSTTHTLEVLKKSA